MTVHRILQDGHPALRQVAAPVEVFDAALEQLAQDLFETMRAADGIGLAAPQIGVPLRLIVVGLGGVIITMANPVILRQSGQQRSLEGCLSVPREQWNKPVARAAQVRVEYQDPQGVKRHWTANARRAACIQHEIDHLNGVLFTDYVFGARRMQIDTSPGATTVSLRTPLEKHSPEAADLASGGRT